MSTQFTPTETGTYRLNFRMRQAGYAGDDHIAYIDDVRINELTNETMAITSTTDYYPFGMPMPGRQLINGEPYRYGYQGEFAEKDPETGMEAFELRLWDSRIGRWLTPDPYGQYASPYLGMGNDPANGIDPDGGWKTKWGQFWGWVGNGFKGERYTSEIATGMGKYGIAFNYGGGSGEGDLTGTFMAVSRNDIDSWNMNKEFANWSFMENGQGFDVDVLQPGNSISKLQFWRDSPNDGVGDGFLKAGVNLTYGTYENVYSIFSGKRFAGENLQGYHRTDAGLDGLITLATLGTNQSVRLLKELKSTPALFNQFARNTRGIFKGKNHAQLRSKAYREMIKNHNISIKDLKTMHGDFDSFDTKRSIIIEFINQTID